MFDYSDLVDTANYERDVYRAVAERDLIDALRQAIDDGELPSTARIRFEWKICNFCSGHGSHSRHLGVINVDDWDDDSFDDYMAGVYDTDCVQCGGSGKVREIAPTNDEAVSKWVLDYRRDAYDSAEERRAERLAGC